MATSVIESGLLKLTGDDYGWARAEYPIPAAPATTKRMQFFIRAWVVQPADGSSVVDVQELNPWENAFTLGLSFTGTFPLIDPAKSEHHRIPHSDVLGWIMETFRAGGQAFVDNEQKTRYKVNLIGPDVFLFPGGLSIGGFNWSHQYNRFYDGRGVAIISSLGTPPGNPLDNDEAKHGGFPGSVEVGANWSQMWEVWGSDIDNSVYYLIKTTMDGVENIKDTATAASYSPDLTGLVHGDNAPTNWRNANGTMKFPSHFLAQWPYRGNQFVVDEFQVRYFDSVS
jgi:hypothetical protein